MCGEKCQIVSDCAFDPLGLHVDVTGWPLTSDICFHLTDAASGAGLRSCFTSVNLKDRYPMVGRCHEASVQSPPASSTSFANRTTAATPASVVGGVVASFQAIALISSHIASQRFAASHASSERMPYLASASSWASMTSQWATSAARCAVTSAKAGSAGAAANKAAAATAPPAATE